MNEPPPIHPQQLQLPAELRFGGATYDHARDSVRLSKQWRDVWRYASDGEWYTLRGLAALTGHPEASISARLRDLRKPRFGGHTVERQYVEGGLWMYRVTPNPNVEVIV